MIPKTGGAGTHEAVTGYTSDSAPEQSALHSDDSTITSQ